MILQEPFKISLPERRNPKRKKKGKLDESIFSRSRREGGREKEHERRVGIKEQGVKHVMGMATATEHPTKGRAGPTRFWVAVKNTGSKWASVWTQEAHVKIIDRGMYRATCAAGEVEATCLGHASY